MNTISYLLKKNSRLIIIFTMFLILILYFILFIYNPAQSNNQVRQLHGNNAKYMKEYVIAEPSNPFKHKGALYEANIQNYIHWMSHQKVVADKKWIHYHLTEERVNWLLEKVNEGDFVHKSLYIDILERWKEGDFSRADKDHNSIWTIQRGDVGEATAVFTNEQEEAYLRKYRRKLK
ncbi:MAG: DUF6241 domain-containing protein [Bacillaceae bacterium]|nr:DUF6241 domain-containing protein [Bacillaceae bacterium]